MENALKTEDTNIFTKLITYYSNLQIVTPVKYRTATAFLLKSFCSARSGASKQTLVKGRNQSFKRWSKMTLQLILRQPDLPPYLVLISYPQTSLNYSSKMALKFVCKRMRSTSIRAFQYISSNLLPRLYWHFAGMKHIKKGVLKWVSIFSVKESLHQKIELSNVYQNNHCKL